MAEEKKFQFDWKGYPTLNTRPTTLRWPKLVKPGKKYKSEDEEFITECVMSAAEGEEWAAKVLRPLVDKAWAEFSSAEMNKKKVKLGYKPNYDFLKPEFDSDGEETGNVIFKAKVSAVRKDRKTGVEKAVEIPLWDAAGKRIPHGSVNPYGGTVARVKFDVNPYEMGSSKTVGISFRLREVQIIKLVEGGERAPSGFDAVDDEDAYHTSEEGFDAASEGVVDEPAEGAENF